MLCDCSTPRTPPASPLPPLDPAATAVRLAERRLDDPIVIAALLAAGSAPPSQPSAWDLDALTVAAWQLRGEVASARRALDAARAGERVAAVKPERTLNLTTELVSALAGLNPWTIALALGSTFESHGKRKLQTERAAAETAVQTTDVAAALWKVRAEVRTALVEGELRRRESALAERELSLRTDFSQWLGTQLALGAASRPDLATAEAERARAEGEAELARIEGENARGRLASALGLPPNALAAVSLSALDLEALPAPWSDEEARALRDRAVLDRLDLHRKLADYAVAVVDLRTELAKRFPDLTLGPGFTYDRGDRKLVLGVGLTLPRKAKQSAAIEQATARVAQAAAEVERVEAQALTEAAGAIERYVAVYGALERAESARNDRAATVANAERRRDLGAADRGDVLTAALAELESRRAALTLRRAAVEALGEVEREVERPVWPPSTLPTEPANASSLAFAAAAPKVSTPR